MSQGRLTRQVPTEQWGHEPLCSDGIHRYCAPSAPEPGWSTEPAQSSHLPVCHIHLPLLLLGNSTDTQTKLGILLYSANITETLWCASLTRTLSPILTTAMETTSDICKMERHPSHSWSLS